MFRLFKILVLLSIGGWSCKVFNPSQPVVKAVALGHSHSLGCDATAEKRFVCQMGTFTNQGAETLSVNNKKLASSVFYNVNQLEVSFSNSEPRLNLKFEYDPAQKIAALTTQTANDLYNRAGCVSEVSGLIGDENFPKAKFRVQFPYQSDSAEGSIFVEEQISANAEVFQIEMKECRWEKVQSLK